MLTLMKRMMKSELYNDVWPFPSVNAGHRVFFKTKKKEEKKNTHFGIMTQKAITVRRRVDVSRFEAAKVVLRSNGG